MPRRGKARGKTVVELEGVDELRKALLRLDSNARENALQVIRESADEILAEAQARIPVDTGETRSKLSVKTYDFGFVGSIGTAFYKARFLELGTRKMAARPFLFPAFEVVRPKYLQRLEGALNRAGKDAEVA